VIELRDGSEGWHGTQGELAEHPLLAHFGPCSSLIFSISRLTFCANCAGSLIAVPSACPTRYLPRAETPLLFNDKEGKSVIVQ
jgi:hypothetical protein